MVGLSRHAASAATRRSGRRHTLGLGAVVAVAGLAALACLIVACGGAPGARTVADTAQRAAATTPRHGAGTDSVAGAAAVSPEVRAVCDTVADSWLIIPAASVIRADSILAPPAHGVVPPSAACTVSANAPDGVPDSLASRLYWSAPGSRGWIDLWTLQADGAGSGSQVFQRGPVRCYTAYQVDEDDAAGPDYVPEPYYQHQTACWRYPSGVDVRDTTPAS